MTTHTNRPSVDDLRREVGRLDPGAAPDYRAFTPAPADTRLRETDRTKTQEERGPFGRWLLQQVDRDGLIGQLAAAARIDRAFPKDGDPEAVRKRLNALGADPDMHEALDDAEMDWSSY